MNDDQFKALCNTFGFAPSRALREMLDKAMDQAFTPVWRESDEKHREAQAAIYRALGTENPDRDAWPEEIRALKLDAERYRYLRNRNPQEILPVIGPPAGAWIDCDDEDGELILLTGEDADAVIDAERGKE